MSEASPSFPWRDLARPRFWPVLFVLGLGAVVGRLPRPVQRGAGHLVAAILWRIPRIRHVTRANLAACLPGLGEAERAALARQTTFEAAFSLVQSLRVWTVHRRSRPAYRIDALTGADHLAAALATGRGVLLLACHYRSTEVNGCLADQIDRAGRRFVGVYRKPKEPGIDRLLHWARAGYTDRLISGRDVRDIVRELRDGAIVWFAPDLEKARQGAVYVPFFGVPAGTTTATARIAQMGRALVLPIRHREDARSGRITVEIFPPLADFPSPDIEADTARVNAAIEAMIRDEPAPYWWCLERFLHRPEGVPKIY